MDDLRPDAVAARVAAWHNRHPLARRITPAHVQAIGFVALPFVARPGAARSDQLADLPTLPLSDATLGPAPGSSALRARVRAQAAPQRTLPPGEDPPFDGPSDRPSNSPAALRSGAPLAPSGGMAAVAALSASWARWCGRQRAARLVRHKAALRAKALKAAFTERLLPDLPANTVARWALRHGRLDVRRMAPNAMRRVLPDERLLGDTQATTTLYLATAAIEVGKRRARVLLGDGPAAGAIGGRLLSAPRVAGSVAMLVLAASVLVGPPLPQVQDLAALPQTDTWKRAVTWLRHHSGNDPALHTAGPRLAAADAAASQPAAADAAPAAAGAVEGREQALERAPEQAPEPAALPAEPEVRMADAAPARRVHAPTAMPAEPPTALFPDDPPPGADTSTAAAPAAPTAPTAPISAAHAPLWLPGKPARAGIPAIRPQLDEATKTAARKAVADLRAAHGEAAPVPQPPSSPAERTVTLAAKEPAPAPLPPAVQHAAAGAPAYALSTRLLRTRAESEQVLVAWRALLADDQRNPLNVSVMPAGEDWRVVCWPFSSRQDADKARGLLAARGLRAETIDF